MSAVSKFFWTICGFWLCGLFIAAGADTYQLTDGKSITGDVISYNDNGIVFRLEADTYSDRIPWTKFTQDALKQLSKNPKVKPLADPFIETPPVQKAKKGPVTVGPVTRLDLPPKESLIAALFSSSVGLVALLLIYAANIYAGYEVAVCRSRPIALVMGVAVVLPILGPIIFLAMPVQVEAAEPAVTQPEAAPQTFTVPGQQAAAAASAAAPASGIHIVEASWQGQSSAAPAASADEQVFQRGQFTFNRRFFETKFSGFFGVIRRDADKNKVLMIKTGRGQNVVERITRISTNEMHVEVAQGAAKQEIQIPFVEIVEVQLKTKGA